MFHVRHEEPLNELLIDCLKKNKQLNWSIKGHKFFSKRMKKLTFNHLFSFSHLQTQTKNYKAHSCDFYKSIHFLEIKIFTKIKNLFKLIFSGKRFSKENTLFYLISFFFFKFLFFHDLLEKILIELINVQPPFL